jgi:hypothetical protein
MHRVVLRYHKSFALFALFGLTLAALWRLPASVQIARKKKELLCGSLLAFLVTSTYAGMLSGEAIADGEMDPPPNWKAPRELAREAPEEKFNAYYQATYVWQRHPGFPARYTGPNSLNPNAERGYSFTATAYFGWRPWPGGELYFNPEAIRANALSGLTGLGGLTNGENQKSATQELHTYRARLFLRQTWGFGGGKERLESLANQLGGEVDQRRLVLTAGNVALIDIFDVNPYSHDPRTHFLNWALMTHGAFDYAADARGYTWGAALEYYADDWVFRVGRFMQPVESNGLRLDHRIMRHYGDQIEIEHAHEVAGLSGNVRLLAFRNYARMGGFRDALDFAAANGGTPDVANVRKDRNKHGFGININQAVSNDLGFLVRASWNDGQTETYAFTEIERSVTFGLKLTGSRWGRSEDAVYLGAVRNGLSDAHRDYLAAGGIGFFIGDGQINYHPEEIAEVMYVVRGNRWLWVAFDFQHIRNPAYNADRGPVNVFGARVHVEF